MKIDVSKIEGYAEMSAEDKLKALEEYEFEAPKDNSEEVKNLKESLSKANSQAAEWKRQFREKQTEQERAEAERAEREKETAEKLASYERKFKVSDLFGQYTLLGYSKDLAQKAAEATADGNTAVVMECQQEFLAEKQKELEAAALNKQPTITSGSPPTAKQADHDAINRERAWFGLPPLK
jgi:hypothetical protein